VTHSRLAVADYLALRFAIAAVVLLAVRPAAVGRLRRLGRRRGVALGVTYGVAQLLQTEVLRHTSASVSGFVTGMYVVFTPLLAAVILRHRIERSPAGSRCRAGAGTGCVCSSWRWSRARWH